MFFFFFFIISTPHQDSFLGSGLCPLTSLTLAISLLYHRPCQCWDWTIFSLNLSISAHATHPFWSTFYLLPCLLFDFFAFQTRLRYQLNTFLITLSNAYYVPDASAWVTNTVSVLEGQGIQWHQTSPVFVRVCNWMQQSTCIAQPLDTVYFLLTESSSAVRNPGSH